MNFFSKGRRLRTFLLVFLGIPFIIGGGTAGYFLYKVWKVSNVITVETNNVESVQPVKKEESGGFHMLDFVSKQKLPERGKEKRINILLLGKATPDYPGSNLTDTIILASINPKTYQSSLLSVPRDLYVRIPDTKSYTKINAVYVHGLKQGGHQKGMELLKEVLDDVLDQPVDYYVMVNFSAFTQAVDLIGGVDVEVEENIYDNRYPAPGYAYQTFEIDKGRHHLDGETALKYVRVRHNAGGDFGRARRQQQVLEAVKKDFFAKRGVRDGMKFFNEILKVVQENVKADIPFRDYLPFLILVKNVNIHQTVNKVLENSQEGLLEAYRPVMGRVRAYTLRPRAGNYYEIRRVAENMFDLNKIERQNNAISSENSKVAVTSSPHLSSYLAKIKKILKEEGYDVITEDMSYNKIFLWRRPLEAKLPELSKENRSTVSSESIIEKEEIAKSSLKQTTIYDNAEGSKPFSLEDVSDRLRAQVSLYKDYDSKADFIVILGNNVEQVLREEKEGEFFLTEEGLKQEEMEVYED